MSKFIDQLKAESGDTRSERELTLIFGDQLDQDGRSDIFDSHPDFLAEYKQLKGEISRLNRGGLGSEFMSGLRAGGQELAGAGLGLAALAADTVGADETASSLIGKARGRFAAAEEEPNSVPSVVDISGDHPIEDSAYYLSRAAGGMLPSLGMAAAGTLAGAAAGTAVEPGGGTVAGGIAGMLEGFAGKQAIQAVLKQAAKQGIKMTVEDATALVTKQLAQKVGAEAAVGGLFSAEATGRNYAQNPDDPLADVAFGVASGVLGSIAPSYVLSKMVPNAANEALASKALGYWERFSGEVAKTVPIGAGSTAASALVDIAAAKYARGEDPATFTEDDWLAALNAGVIGGVGGAILTPLAAIKPRSGITERMGTPMEPKIDTTNLPPEVAEAVRAAEAARPPEPVVKAAPAAAGVASEVIAPVAETPTISSRSSLGDLVGREIEYQGYRGTLIRDDEGNFGVLRSIADDSPSFVEIADTGKDPAKIAGEVGVGLFAKDPDPSWRVISTAQRGDVPGMVMVEMKAADGTITTSSPEYLVRQGYQLPAVDNIPQGEYTVGELQAVAKKLQPRDVTPVPIPSPDNVMPLPKEKPEYRYTVQRAQEHPDMPGQMIPGYVQIDEVIGGKNTRSANLDALRAEGIDLPDVPDAIGTGNYSLEDIRAAAPKAPERVAAPLDSVRRQTLLDLGFSEKNVDAMDKATADRLIQTKIAGIDYTQRAAPETQEFTKWFGDSKVVNEGGRPREVYHGTRAEDNFASFDPNKRGETGTAASKKAFFFTSEPDVAANFSGDAQPKARLVPVYLSLQNPLIVDHSKYTQQEMLRIGHDSRRDSIQKAIRSGNDGVIFKNTFDFSGERSDVFAVFKAEQIKSSIGNSGEFDAANPDITATARTSGDFISAPSSAANLLDSAVKALAMDRGIPVAPLTKSIAEGVGAAVQTAGVTIDRGSAGKLVGYSLDTVNGVLNPQSVIALVHEAAHVFTSDLPPERRVLFQRALENLPWSKQRWLNNPESLDVRLMANADPATLSERQRAALSKLSAEELAAAKRISPEQLAGEKMAEHLAQLGWDKKEAVGLVDRFFRFVKDLWYQTSMAIQKALKGDAETNPELVRQFVENRFLQFISRDAAVASDRINSLFNWIGVPATTRERQPVFPGGADGEMRMQFADSDTGTLIPVSYAIYTPDSQKAFIQRAIDNAARYMQDQNGKPVINAEQVALSRRTNFSKPLPFDPEGTSNVALASLNLEDEIYTQIRNDRNIAGLLPRVNGALIDHPAFLSDWMKLPAQQHPGARRTAAVEFAKSTVDPLTGQPVAFDPAITLDKLPSFRETLVGKEKEKIQIQLSEQQDEAVRQTIWSLRDTQRRVRNKLEKETARLNELIAARDELKSEFPKSSARELDQLQRDTLVRAEVLRALAPRIDQLDSKFDPSAQVKVYPTAEYLRVPGRDADESGILQNKRGVVPRDLNFSNDSVKSAFGQDLADMKAWLSNPDNREKGVIYGRVEETYRKLMQLPVDLQRANTAAILRRTITTGLSEELRLSGMPALVALGKKFNTVTRVIGENRVEATKLGNRWAETFGKFAEAMGTAPDQAFRDNVWDSLMRTWNHIDVSKRGQVKSDLPGAPVDLVVRAMNDIAGVKIETPAQREALRDLMLATIDNERWQMGVELQNDIKINDPELGYERRLIPRGLAAGRRGIARHMAGLYMRMNPDWSATAAISENEPRTFWQAAPDLYGSNRPVFDQNMAKLFPSYVVNDFVEPLVNNNTPLFDAPKTLDDSSPRKASLVRVRQAWRDTSGDVTKFAERLHELEGGAKGDEKQTVANVLLRLRQRFNEIKADQDGRIGSEGVKREVLPRQIMDARLAHDWPAEWVSYSTYSPADNLTLLHQLGVAAGLGKDALAQNSEINMTIAESRRDLSQLWARHEELTQQGMSPKQIEGEMGVENAKLARRYYALSENLNSISGALASLTTNSGYLSGDFRAFNAALGFASGMMIQNPRSGLINIIGDVQGPLAALKFSRPGIKAFFGAGGSVARDMATSLVRAAGIDIKFNADLAHEMYVNGAMDPDQMITWKQKQFNFGPSQTLAAPAGYESKVAKAGRTVTRLANRGRDILPNIGSPFQAVAKEGDEAAAVTPKLRLGFFGTTALSTAFANNRAGYTAFADLSMRGVKYLNSLPEATRTRLLRELEQGTKTLDNRQLGYERGLFLNDEAAFNYLKDAIETKMSGESSVGRFIAKAYRRQEEASGGKWPILANSQFSDIINLTNSEWTLQNNISTVPPWMNGPLRPLFTFLTWPYLAMHRFGKSFTDPRGRLTFDGMNSTVADGMKTFFVIAAPATIAGSFAIDLYDKYVLGKKQNMREAGLETALPFVGPALNPAGFMERIGRYGSAGFATDVLNRIVNYDTQRNLSLDDRIVAISSIENLLNTVAVEPFQTGGNITYGSTVRPFLQAVGGGGILQYLQISNNLFGLNNEDAAINARINTNNYLRSAGRELDLPVRVMTGAAEAPTPVSPYTRQMELAAIVDNPELFREAYKSAIEAARDMGKDDPEKYVAENFADRHPLRRSFRTSPSETEYRQLLSLMDGRGAGQVRQAVNNYNRYHGAYFSKEAFYGKKKETVSKDDIDELIRKATKLPEPAGVF